MSQDDKIKHLQMIQDVVKRMADTSAAMKRYALVAFAATAAMARALDKPSVLLVAGVLVLVFWILDAQYLRQEKWFRAMYDDVRGKDEENIDFDLTPPGDVRKRITICAGLGSRSTWLLYGPLLAIVLFLWLGFAKFTTTGDG